VVDFYLCTEPDVPATATGCPPGNTVLLEHKRFTGLKKDVTKYFTKLELIQQTLVYKILKAVLVDDFIECWHGSAGACAWAASNFIPGKAFTKIADGLRALDAALKTGIGVADAFKALKVLDMDPAALAKIEGTVNAYEDVLGACRLNSFPGETQVLMADRTRKAIRDVRLGDLVLANDPETGELGARPVTDTFLHDTEHLVDISVAGGLLTSTAGHRFYVTGRGWTMVSDLRTGDGLRTSAGVVKTVTALHDRPNLTPSQVYDLTVDGLQTFYVRPKGAESQDVLVHNCTDLIGDEGVSGAHTLADHVRKSDAAMYDKAQIDGVAGKWPSETAAAAAVKQAMDEWVKHGDNAQKLADWKVKEAQRIGKGTLYDPKKHNLTLEWTLSGSGSLGRVWFRGGERAGEAAGRTVRVVLKYMPKVKGEGQHADKYVIYTSFPLPN
jgi:hypothetical protein